MRGSVALAAVLALAQACAKGVSSPALKVPDVPADLVAVAGDGHVVLRWSASARAASYALYRSTARLADVVSSPFTDTGVTNGVTYFYVVTAVNAAGESAPSAIAIARPQAIPLPPTGLGAMAGYGQVSLSWIASARTTGYALHWSTGGATTRILLGDITAYVHTGLTNDTTYSYSVTALGPGGESAPSPQVSATPRAPLPAAPTGVAASAGDAQDTVSWNPVARANGYDLYWTTAPGVILSSSTQIAGVTSPYLHTGLTNGATYRYVVTAVNAAGQGPPSAEVHAQPLAAHDTWRTKAAMPTPRGYASTEVIDGIIYVFGGFAIVNQTPTALDAVEAYDVSTDTWSTKASLPLARYGAFSGAVGGVVYLLGGAGANGGNLNRIDAYDRSSDGWSGKAPMPDTRYWPASTAFNSRIFALGGGVNGGTPNSVSYDPAGPTWTSKAVMPALRYGAATAVVSGVVYVAGGLNGGYDNPGDVYAYDLAGDSWSTKASLPTARGYACGAQVSGTVYVFGGFPNGSGTALATAEAYDLGGDSWSAKTAMPTARVGPACAAVGGVVYVIGGNATLGAALGTVEAYIP